MAVRRGLRYELTMIQFEIRLETSVRIETVQRSNNENN